MRNTSDNEHSSGEQHGCPTCGGPIQAIERRGPTDVFVRPCGHDVSETFARDFPRSTARARTDGGSDRPPFVDPNADYTRCHFCGETWDVTAVDGFDLSAEDEYYPKMVPICPEHAGGCR